MPVLALLTCATRAGFCKGIARRLKRTRSYPFKGDGEPGDRAYEDGDPLTPTEPPRARQYTLPPPERAHRDMCSWVGGT
eukprot:scaffold3713_cov372-Prasinococcus_capsulatus_cf.AAC.3